MIELIEKIDRDGRVDDTVTLPYDLRQKTRHRVRLDSGREAAIVLAPGTTLDDGDRVRADDGTSVRVVAAAETLSTVRTNDPLRFARACYHLGNRHVPLQVGDGWARYQPDHVLDDMVRGLGLTVTQEAAPFQPERGAYHGTAPAHHHHDGHAHAHRAHDHSHHGHEH